MGMNEAHVALSHEPTQPEQGAEICRASHPDGLDRQARRARIGAEGAVRLTGDQRPPAAGEEPAYVGHGANLLTAVAAGRLGVQDGRHTDRLPPCALEPKNASGFVRDGPPGLPAGRAARADESGRRYQRPPREPPRPAPPPPPKPPRPPPPPRRSPPPPPDPGAFAFST